MRRGLMVLAILGLISALTWFFWAPQIQVAQMVPARLLGLVMINRFPDSLDFLSKTRLGEWLDLDATELQDRVESGWFVSLKGNLERACIVVHTFERKENGAFRPHFTALLRPKPNRSGMIGDWIREEVMKSFNGDAATIVEEGSAQVIRGPEEGQVLFLAVERGWLVVSNSELGWKDVQLTLAGRAPALGTRQSFREIEAHVGSDVDLFFYFSGEGLAPLLSEFGYGVSVNEEAVTDVYWSPVEEQSRDEP